MKKIEQKVLKFIDEKNLIEKNDKVLVGLSGGPDSVFLLHFLKKYSKKLQVSFGALHINHLLRGKEADKDEQFCKELTEKLSVKFYSVRKNIKAIASKEKISAEEAGRKVRYKEFEEILVKEGYTKIATAHNADENAETVFLNLIKGTGLRGISGIPPSRDNIIRPLLALTKKEILDYLDFNKLKYRTDLTNLTDDAERNFLRNKVIPLIRDRLNPSLSNTLLKSSEVFRNINNLIKKKINEASDNLISVKENYLSLSLPELNKIEVEYRSEVLRHIFNKEFGIQISFDDCSKVLSLLNKQAGKSIQIFENIKVTRDRTELIIQKEKDKKEFKPIIVNRGDSIKINGKELSIKEVGTIKQNSGSNKNLEFINGDKTSKDFLVRKWMPGDRFFPFGMRGSKKISDFLNEQKISSLKKKEQIILLNQDRIVWVIGLRLDERFRITSETKRIFQLCLS
ncbi:MAG: tRNA lysidine(34) synthetase TilS [Ignavibacteria bacterium]|nr:tRNA lysidine(34) synthetase TilS [Ignavibacteria bacterium]